MNQIQSVLLGKLQEVRLRVGTNHPLSGADIESICKELAPVYGRTTEDNLSRIIAHLTREQGLLIDDLITMLKKNDGFDRITAERESEDNFDERYGTLTSPIITQFELPENVSVDRLMNSARYHPSPIASVIRILDSLETYGVTYEDYIFIDIGSGLGRNLLLASNYGFHRIIGIEHSGHLHSIAKQNIEKYCGRSVKEDLIELHCIDALDYTFPHGNMLLYFWWPFDEATGAKFFAKLTAHIEATGVRVILAFLEFIYPAIESSGIFRQIDTFQTTDISNKMGNFFQAKIYATDQSSSLLAS